MKGKWDREGDEGKRRTVYRFCASPPYDREKIRKALHKTMGPQARFLLQEAPEAHTSAPRRGNRNHCSS
jgi:hypothetical protein